MVAGVLLLVLAAVWLAGAVYRVIRPGDDPGRDLRRALGVLLLVGGALLVVVAVAVMRA